MVKSLLKRIRNFLNPPKIVKANITVLSPNSLLTGRRAIITGGTSGIGFQIAKSFLNAGAKVLITGRSQSRINDSIDKICKDQPEYADRLIGLEMDVTDIPNMENRFQEAVSLLGGVDILVNNAGLEGGHINWCTENEFDSIINTNMKGVFFLSKIVGRYMVSNKVQGNILNLCSSSSLRPANSVYTMTKWAVRSLTEGLARMLIPYGIVVNGIAPGLTATPMLHKKDSSDDLHHQKLLTGRYATAEEIANMAVILVSDMCRMVVGDVLYMTGGSGIIYHEDINYKFE